MSHVETVSVTVSDLDVVKAACTRLGVEFRENQKTYGWFGRHMADYPLPAGVTKEELGKCEHAIHLPGCAYEIGLMKNKEGKGYKLAFDFWGGAKQGGGLLAKFGKGMTHLIDAYSVEALKAKARRLGYMSHETRLPNGTIQLKVTGF